MHTTSPRRHPPARLAPAAAFALSLLTFLGARSAGASERHFNRTYETGVLGPGHVELEPSTTWRYGRTDFYNAFDERLEFEFGVVENLQASLYWNFSAVAEDQVDPVTNTKVRTSSFEFESLSSEWKLKLTDPVADPIGFGLYFEATFGPTEAEIEPKILLDKRVGDLLLAANIVGAAGWEFAEAGKTESELEISLDLGGGYFVGKSLLLGAEIENKNVFEEGSLYDSIVYAGPSVAYAAEGWWVSGSVMPQLVAFKGVSPGSRLNLTDEDRLQTRVNFGFAL